MEHNKIHNYRSVFGRSTVDIDCPFCGTTTRAFVWSLAGGGKKCKCGALHTRLGTHPPKEELKKVTQ